MKCIFSLILFFTCSHAFAENCEREEVRRTLATNWLESLALYEATGIRMLGGVIEVRPAGSCSAMNDSFMKYFENNCKLAFETKKERSKSDNSKFEFSCYQESTSLAVGKVNGKHVEVELPHCYFCRPRGDTL